MTTSTYNAGGQRLTKVEGGTTTRFAYDGAKVVLERDGDDETEVRYTHEGGSLYDDLLSQRRDGASYDYLLDGLASVKQIVDSSQAIENSYSYEAFGQATVGQSDVSNPYLFVGGYGVQWESTPSLYFMQARYYGPGVGRFISEDPYGGSPQDPLSLHRYLYCGNGPVVKTDAAGMVDCWMSSQGVTAGAGVGVGFYIVSLNCGGTFYRYRVVCRGWFPGLGLGGSYQFFAGQFSDPAHMENASGWGITVSGGWFSYEHGETSPGCTYNIGGVTCGLTVMPIQVFVTNHCTWTRIRGLFDWRAYSGE